MNRNFTQRFEDYINDDLNMPRVLALVWELVGSDLENGIKKATLLHFDQVLGLDIKNVETNKNAQNISEIPKKIEDLAILRQNARLEKDWVKADLLRNEIIAAGFEIEDREDGHFITPKLPPQIKEWIHERNSAREMKDWSLADQIREKITEAGFEIVDSPSGTEARPIS